MCVLEMVVKPVEMKSDRSAASLRWNNCQLRHHETSRFSDESDEGGIPSEGQRQDFIQQTCVQHFHLTTPTFNRSIFQNQHLISGITTYNDIDCFCFTHDALPGIHLHSSGRSSSFPRNTLDDPILAKHIHSLLHPVHLSIKHQTFSKGY